jgi:hypothetical protein
MTTIQVNRSSSLLQVATALGCDVEELIDLNNIVEMPVNCAMELDHLRVPAQLNSSAHGFGMVATVAEAAQRCRATLVKRPIPTTLGCPPRPKRLIENPFRRIRHAIDAETSRVSELGDLGGVDIMTAIDDSSTRNILKDIAAEVATPWLKSLTSCNHVFDQAATFEPIPRGPMHHALAHPIPSASYSSERSLDPAEAAIVEFLVLDGGSRVKECWEVLSSSPLKILRDAIDCNMRSLPHAVTSNSMMFIHGTFFVDDSVPDGEFCDLSEPIRHWVLDDHSRPYGSCQVFSMNTTPIDHIVMRMGETCLFRHIGHCDHLFVFRNVRLPNAGDKRSDFPRRTFLAQERALLCDVCSRAPARLAVYGDTLCPFHPTVLCRRCTDLLHPSGSEPPGTVSFQLPSGVLC